MENDIAFLDVEASGLERWTYPIEAGWVLSEVGKPESRLIRPHKIWDEYEWNMDSQKVHGIDRNDLFKFGLPVEVVANELNMVFKNHRVLVTALSFDEKWINELFDQAGIERCFRMGCFNTFLIVEYIEQWDSFQKIKKEICQKYPATHCAGDDAYQMFKIYEYLRGASMDSD